MKLLFLVFLLILTIVSAGSLWKHNVCNNPIDEPTLATPTTFKILWVEACTPGDAISADFMSKTSWATELLNQEFASVGVQFASSVWNQKVACKGTAGPKGKVWDFTSASIEMTNNIVVAKQSLAISSNETPLVFFVTENRQNQKEKSLMMIPWGRSKLSNGVGFIHPSLLVNSNTIVHEMGHAFGLWHIFRGNDEAKAGNECSSLGETDSNGKIAGDLIEDTLATFYTHLSKRFIPYRYTKDHCRVFVGGNKKFWDNDFRNFMSYSHCRYQFTPLQIQRMKCFLNKKVVDYVIDQPQAVDVNIKSSVEKWRAENTQKCELVWNAESSAGSVETEALDLEEQINNLY